MLNQKTSYIKTSSYEAKDGEVKRVLLLYSGGLDTSVMLKWIQDNYHAKVVTLTMNLGQQHDDLKAIERKAIKLGAEKTYTMDVRKNSAANISRRASKRMLITRANTIFPRLSAALFWLKKRSKLPERKGLPALPMVPPVKGMTKCA